jgi:hypothetical protein
MKKILILLIVMNSGCSGRNEMPQMHNLKEEIPILAWYSIPPSETTLARYEELKEAGITYKLSFCPDTVTMQRALDTAYMAGIKVIVSCPELKSNTESTVRMFMNHPAVAGYMLRDEPGRADFKELGEWARKIEAVDSNHFCYLNLFPNYASEEQLGTKTYKEHVDLFVKEVPLKLLSFDHYPVVGDSLRFNWYDNLEIIARAARESGKPFWAFALSVAHGPYPVPTIAQIRLQVYSNLAYGAQGIQYFTYWTPYDTTWNFNNGPITLEGKRTVVYDRIALVNKEIKGLSEIFLGADVISVKHTGKTIPVGTKPLEELPSPIYSLNTEGQGAVVSVLKNGLNYYLVIVNRDFMKTMKLSVETAPEVKRVFKDGSVVNADAYQISSELEPGDIAIYKWSEQ